MILIPIDMPSNCIECPCHNDDMCYCQLLKNDKADWEMDIDFFNSRRENCPLVEVLTQEVTGITEDTIKRFRELYITGDWSTNEVK